jgi:hypothetical protein
MERCIEVPVKRVDQLDDSPIHKGLRAMLSITDCGK